MKKVLVFGMTDNPGGVESVVMNYYRNIDPNCVQFDFLTNFDNMTFREEVEKKGSKVFVVPKRSKKPIKHYQMLKKIFKEHAKEYDTIWINICLLNNITYIKYAKKYGIKKIIVHAHNSKNMGGFIRGKMHDFFKKRLHKYATDFWSCSTGASEFFYNDYIKNNYSVCIINNAIDVEKFVFDTSARDKYMQELNIKDKLVIGNIGRLHFQKNQEFLLDVFKSIHEKVPESCLLLVGDGPDKSKLVTKVKELNLENEVHFLGRRNDVNKLMSVFDLFLFPSVFEGLSVVLFEVQANGLPIFASKEGIQQESKINDNFHFISLHDSPQKWADVILEKYSGSRKLNVKENIIDAGFEIKSQCKYLIEKF